MWIHREASFIVHYQPPASAETLQSAVVFWFCSPWKHHVTSLSVTEACCCTAVPNALSAPIPQGHDLAVPLN